jgi:4-amino-4-deoxy-L-arabinose transferase-like glycosyltransferase
MTSIRSDVARSNSFLTRLSEENFGLYCLLSFSLLLKLFLFYRVEVITNDGPLYINQAIQILDGQLWFTVKTYVTVLYSALIALISFVIPDMVLAGQTISMTASVLTVIPLYLLFRDIANSRVAFWGCSFFVVLPCFNEYAVEVMRDSLFLLVFVSMILCSWRFLNGGGRKYLIGTMLLAFAGPFLRIESLVFIPFFLYFYFIKTLLKKISLWRCLLISVFIFSILAYLLYNIQNFEFGGRIISSNNIWKYPHHIKEIFKTIESSLPGVGNENTLITTVSDNIRLIYFLGIILIFLKQITFIGFFLLIAGIISNSDNKLSLGKVYVTGLTLIYLFMAFDFNLRMGFMNERYLFVPVLMTLPWMGLGADKFITMASGRFSHVVVSSCLMIFLLIPLGMTIKECFSPQQTSAKMAGDWIRSRADLRGTSLIANERKVPFYANRGVEFTHLEFAPFEKIVQMASQPGEKLISISLRKFNLGEFPGFDGYDLAAKFEDERYASLIYYKKN